ncbi:MAG: ParB/RepB/Spo0J family partition protein [Candidatus Dormiibacterota bacterium]
MTPAGIEPPSDSHGLARPAPRRHGLGRGLDALLASSDPSRDLGGGGGPALLDLDPRRVRPNPEQPRRDFEEGALAALADSIRRHGLLHPIVVEPDADGYRLVAGERRLRAALQAGVVEIPAILRPASQSGRQALELALTENLQREDLNPLEEAAAYARLADAFGLSHEAIAMRVGSTRPTVTNAIRLLQLPAALQEALAARTLTAGHARALLGLRDPDAMVSLGRRVIADGLTVRATEQLVQRAVQEAASGAKSAPPRRNTLGPDEEQLRRGFEIALGLPVQLQKRGSGGRLVIEYAGDEDLDALYRRLGGAPL